MKLFIVGTVGLIGSDDVLACFIAGNVFTWDDWFRLETMDDSLQPTIDMLLNVSVFMWYGAVCPWHKFVANDVIPIYRLIPLGILVLLFRRLPMVLGYHYLGLIHQIEDIKRALFVGFFGPIGVSAIFYLYISREFLRKIRVDGHERADADKVAEAIEVVVWFLCICSIVVHGLSVPLGKLGFYLPRTISTAVSTERISASQSRARDDSPDEPRLRIHQQTQSSDTSRLPIFRRRATTSERGPPMGSPASISWIPKSFARAGRHILSDLQRPHGNHLHDKGKTKSGGDSRDAASNNNGGAHPEISLPTDARVIGHAINDQPRFALNVQEADVRQVEEGGVGVASPTSDRSRSAPNSAPGSGTATPVGGRPFRSILFADEARTSQLTSPSSGSPVEENSQSVGKVDLE